MLPPGARLRPASAPALRMSRVQAAASIRRNIVANYVGRAYSMGATYLFVPFYVAALGIEAYGVIAFYALLLAITALADVGLSATFSREAALRKSSDHLIRLLATSERILVPIVFMAAMAIFVGAEWIAQHWLNSAGTMDPTRIVWPLRLMALMIVPQLMITLYSAGLIGLERQVEANLLQALFVTARSGLIIPLIFWRPDLTLFFGWQLGATLIFAAVSRVVLVRSMGLGPFASAPFDWSVLRPHLSYAGGLAAITMVSSINTQLDKALVSRFFSLGEFGYYNLASTLSQLPIAAAMPIAVAFFPRIVAAVAEGNMPERLGVQRQFGQLIALVASVGGFGLALFAPEVLALWLQSSRVPHEVTQVAATLAIGSFFMCLNIPPYYLCLAYGRSWLVVIVSGLTLFVSVPATFWAIDVFGLLGGGLSWLLLNLIQFALMAYAVSRPPMGERYGRYILAFLPPAALVLGSLIMARLVANAVQAGPLIACVLAGCGAAIAMFAFWRYGRERLNP